MSVKPHPLPYSEGQQAGLREGGHPCLMSLRPTFSHLPGLLSASWLAALHTSGEQNRRPYFCFPSSSIFPPLSAWGVFWGWEGSPKFSQLVIVSRGFVLGIGPGKQGQSRRVRHSQRPLSHLQHRLPGLQGSWILKPTLQSLVYIQGNHFTTGWSLSFKILHVVGSEGKEASGMTS